MVDDIAETTVGVGLGEKGGAVEKTEASSIEQFQEAAGLGRQVLQEVRGRDNSRLTPYFDLKGFDGEDASLLAEDPDEDDITPETISQAKATSFGIALEAANQIVEAQPPRGGMVREDTDSLRRLHRCMVGGDKLRQDLMGEDPDRVAEQMKKVVAKRLKKSPDQVEMAGEQLDAWSKEQFQKAAGRMYGAAQSLQGYFGR